MLKRQQVDQPDVFLKKLNLKILAKDAQMMFECIFTQDKFSDKKNTPKIGKAVKILLVFLFSFF
jgi:hypothetical protein